MNSNETKHSPSKIRGVILTMLVLQLGCSVAIWMISFIPPAIGFGNFTWAINFQILRSILLSGIYALLIGAGIYLSIAARNSWTRLAIFLSVPIVVSAINVLLINLTLSVSVSDFRLILSLAVVASTLNLGIAIIPWLIRIQRGKKLLFKSQTPPLIKKSETQNEIATLLLTLLVAFGCILLVDKDSPIKSIGNLALIIGVIAGAVVTPLVFLVLHAKTTQKLWQVVSVIAGLLIVLPMSAAILFDYGMVLFPGAGQFIFPIAFTSAILLTQLLLLRAMGYRLVDCEFETKLQHEAALKETFDPLAD